MSGQDVHSPPPSDLRGGDVRGGGSSLRPTSATAHDGSAPTEQADYADGEWVIRVFLVADVCVYRELLVDALADEERIDVTGATPGDIATMAIGITEPSVVVVDASTDTGLARVQALTAAAPGAKIVAVGIPEGEADQLEFVEAGVAGYVTVEQPVAEVVEAVEAAANGELRCSPRLSAVLAERVAALQDVAPHGSQKQLTPRERQIAALISEGLSNKQIASRLSIQQATVKNHVHNILAKLGVSRRDAVATLARASLLI
jgi:DNA-binding NarL/FixJ family response regulator